jgi:hypothetical protein
MREPLPLATSGGYDRPHQPWVCGRTECGDPCLFGPGRGGTCPDRPECTPVAVGGVFECTRPAVHGGPCDEGPLPDGRCCRHHKCTPVRNLRTVRGLLSRSMLLLATGVVLLLLGSSWRSQLIVPGPLCQSHAQILRGLPSEQRCQACHAAAETEPTSWISLAWQGEPVGATQSDRCMKCHETLIASTLALDPHNLPAAELRALRDPAGDDPHANLPGELACSTCHQEHHGALNDLTAMDNTKCQACHQRQFASFADGHPDFGIWPYERRTPIAFNHASHAGKHYASKGEKFDCATCHVSDNRGEVQLTLFYQQSCSRCHDTSIATSFAMGLPSFALPMIDVETLGEAGHDVGEWPTAATGDFDGTIPPAMRLLLSRDSQWNEVTKILGHDFQVADVDPDDTQHLAAAALLVKIIKRQLASVDESLPGLPVDVLRQAQSRWLPQLASEVSPAAENGTAGRVPSSTAAAAGASTIDNQTLEIVYHPTGHADPVLKAWLESAASRPPSAERDSLLALLAGPTSPGLCATCHSLEQSSSGALVVSWSPAERPAGRPFTRFSHRPHLTQPELRDCSACHAIEPASAAAGYTGYNPQAFVSDFQPMAQATCAACHNRQGAAAGCTTCHNYHVSSGPTPHIFPSPATAQGGASAN